MEPQMLTDGIGLAIILFVIVLSILWFLLPFAVFGVKRRLDRIIEQNNELIALLQMTNKLSENTGPSNKNEKIEPTINL